MSENIVSPTTLRPDERTPLLQSSNDRAQHSSPDDNGFPSSSTSPTVSQTLRMSTEQKTLFNAAASPHDSSKRAAAGVDVDRFDGTTKLVRADGGILLIPNPTQDPRDSSSGLTLVTALGALIVYIKPEYEQAGVTDEQISSLLTYPNLLLGIGNLVSMPLAVAIGRRPVLLVSTIGVVVGAVLCATNTSFAGHLAARCIASLSAAQCEALVLLMVQDIYFLHQRSRVLQWLSSCQVVFNSSLVISCSYIANSAGWRAYYWMFVGLAALASILTFFFVPETSYERPIQSFIGLDGSALSSQIDLPSMVEADAPRTIDSTAATADDEETQPRSAAGGKFAYLTSKDRRTVDLERYPPRTLSSDMRIFVTRPNWASMVRTVREIVSVFWFPNVLWVAMFNGLFLAADISIQITYGTVLVSPPYNWAETSVSLIQLGQIVVALICVPIVGQAGDWAIRSFARKRGGIHEPEFRLLPFVPPVILGILLTGMYGFVITNPERYHWMAIAFTVDAYLYILLAASTIGTTYLIDSYPKRAGAILVVIPVTRGLVSFGISNGTVGYIANIGAANLFGVYAGVIALFGLMGCVLFWAGKSVRRFCAPWAADYE
ncbi:uncharacterized protein PgNI_11940 [Pyricularia grisea]|uniref:Major facilitator superfamily (MFS) profile domain-containing protein n=1 Tax=Pyricularia grisea TaxID=148305 RepID=A0A6P8AR44_PYRGI|nr:uncharacterized protein PgNI_11940 [Pyricularia grisea]TLD04524.1 hypothetical protein PgNI_11940 [Pyricularia grisea]